MTGLGIDYAIRELRAGQTVTCGNGVLRYEMDANGIIVYRNCGIM